MMQLQLSLDLDSPAIPYLNRWRRHHGLSPRLTTLKRAFDIICRSPNKLFDAADWMYLGVSKRIGFSTRWWLLALKLAVEDSDRFLHPTHEGIQLLTQWDKYLEEPASLWLLHWRLLQPPCHSAALYWFFNLYNRAMFQSNDLKVALGKFAAEVSPRTAAASVVAEANLMLKMYTPGKTIEEDIENPLGQLGLIDAVDDKFHGEGFRWNFSNKLQPSFLGLVSFLTDFIITAAALEFAVQLGRSQSVSLSDLCYLPGSPGMVFKVTQSVLENAIVSITHPNIQIVEGKDWKLYLRFEQPKVTAVEIYQNYLTA